MASLVRRGTRTAPKWFVKFDHDVDEGGTLKRKQRWKLLEGFAPKAKSDPALQDEFNRIKREIAAGRDPFVKAAAPKTAGALFDLWAKALTNRSASNDRTIVRKYLRPKFGHVTVEEITRKVIKEWLGELAAGKKEDGSPRLSAQTQKHVLGVLSRWFTWAIEEEHTTVEFNPVKMVRRPVVVHKKRAWLEVDGEEKLAKLVAAIGSPFDMMLTLGNRTGMRLGELCGLQMKDLDYLDRGYITVSHSYDGPLKEDKRGEGKVKTVPAPVDAAEAFKMHLARRKLQGAKPEDLVFVPSEIRSSRKSGWGGIPKKMVHYHWVKACRAAGLVGEDGKTPALTFYGATRKTAASRADRSDVAVEQISDSLGHADTAMTRKHYIDHRRTTFAPELRLPMLPALNGSKV